MNRPTERTDPRKPRDPGLANAEIALRRAARKVREEARKSGVPLVYYKDGRIVEEYVGGAADPDG